MKILYAIQGTGNGHLSRAIELAPFLVKKAKVDFLISGKSSELRFQYPFKYMYHGLGFYFGNNGGPQYLKSILNIRPIRLLIDILKCPVRDYDFIISDFEPVSAWAASLRNVPCIAMSHHASFLSMKVPRPKNISRVFEWGMKWYAPSRNHIGVDYLPYDKDIFSPVIRNEIVESQVSDKGYITVYLPAYADEILISHFIKFPDYHWKVFSKKTDVFYKQNNIEVYPVDKERYRKELVSCHSAIVGAGFQATSEALFLSKKMLVVPMKAQYEQKCNAAALKKLGIAIVDHINEDFPVRLESWLKSEKPVYPKIECGTERIVERLFELVKI
ncbi:MAG: glycosyl transferase [Bacteroidia bacterium]|nr:glycosyl transferase [Bacteroidia bacterium]